MTNSVSVEECDREAANNVWVYHMLKGGPLPDWLVQAFAHHRIEAIRQSSEREEKLRALVEEAFLEGYSLGGSPRDAGRSWELSESRQALEATNG